MRESTLQRKCLGWVKRARPDLLAVNIHGGGYANKGFPDLLVFGHGRVLAVELKAESGYAVQPHQRVWAARMKRVGTPHRIVKGLPEFRAAVEEVFDDEDQAG